MRVGGWICALATQLMTAIDKTMIKPPTCRFITAPFLNSTYHLFRGAITKSAVLPNARHTKSQFDRTLYVTKESTSFSKDGSSLI